MSLVEGRWLDAESTQVDVALATVMDLIIDDVEQEVVHDPSYWPNAIAVSWKRWTGIWGQRRLISSVLSSQSRRTSSNGRASRVMSWLQSPIAIPRTIGTAILINSIARAPNGRMEPREKLKSPPSTISSSSISSK